mgnify:CR=1 FL=1
MQVRGGVLGRTTPACAGSTPRFGLSLWSLADHPRLRGEHPPAGRGGWRGRGPPPPARGAPHRPECGLLHARTTPACAGSTRATAAAPSRNADHPRLRGEHHWTPVTRICRGGPPPPARGAQAGERVRVEDPRTTPACAGSTTLPAVALLTIPDHPRLRGEHRRAYSVPSVAGGPPPPARGALGLRGCRERRCRTTPACAGSTWPPATGSSIWTDHPRLRGEHQEAALQLLNAFGPPPPARGAPAQTTLCGALSRTTPACAGSTPS